MRNKKIITSIIILIIGIIATTTVLGAEAKLALTGENTVKAGKTGTMYVKVSSEEGIGSVTCVINKSDNISSIKCTGENGWTVTANESISKYNLYKATGGKDESIMKIEYTLSAEAKDEAKIEVKEITGATTEGTDLEMSSVAKTVVVEIEKDGPTEEPSSNTGNNVLENTAKKPIAQTGIEDTMGVILSIVAIIGIISYISYIKYKNI